MRLIVATHNKNKMNELREKLNSYFEDVVDLVDLQFDDIEETGETFYDNAKLKATAILKHYPNDAILADDSGLCVFSLNDQPGVYSARFLGEDVSAYEKNCALLELLKNKTNRKARFVCCMVYLEKNHEFMTQQEVVGTISESIDGEKGFGYDPIFIPDGYHESFACIPEVKQELSHRAKAVSEVLKHVQFFKK